MRYNVFYSAGYSRMGCNRSRLYSRDVAQYGLLKRSSNLAPFLSLSHNVVLGWSSSQNWFVHSEKKDGADVPDQMTTGMCGASCVALVFRV